MKRRLFFFISAILIALAGCNNREWSSGDRVLVSKFQYEANVADPKRFDVVVFKFPSQPLKKNVPTNYIKRLLGLPGEIMAILFGRLYRVPAPEPGNPPHFDDLLEKANDLWESRFMHANESVDLFEAGKFEIIRKPPEVMMAMRRIVYDNDFPAKDLKGPGWERWLPAEGSAWTSAKDHGFSLAADMVNDQVDWLRYRHIVRPLRNEPHLDGAPPQLITDFMSYNAFISTGMEPSMRANWVGDLMLECKLEVTKAEGEFWMELSKGINRFRARWDLASGMCTLYKQGPDGKPEELDSKPTRVKAPGTYHVRLANFDARLTVWVDRDLPFDNGRDYPPPEIRAKDETPEQVMARRGPTKNDLEPASLGSKGAAVQVHNIRLWRDTYYTQTHSSPSDFDFDAADPNWDGFKGITPKTLYVQPGHYLCLGDNSPQSSDSRDWGVVPQRLMLGRALLVYFPFNRAGVIR